jgi:hypothetical protein
MQLFSAFWLLGFVMLSFGAWWALLHRVIVRIVVGHCTHCMCLLGLNFSLCNVVRTVELYALYCTGVCLRVVFVQAGVIVEQRVQLRRLGGSLVTPFYPQLGSKTLG